MLLSSNAWRDRQYDYVLQYNSNQNDKIWWSLTKFPQFWKMWWGGNDILSNYFGSLWVKEWNQFSYCFILAGLFIRSVVMILFRNNCKKNYALHFCSTSFWMSYNASKSIAIYNTCEVSKYCFGHFISGSDRMISFMISYTLGTTTRDDDCAVIKLI